MSVYDRGAKYATQADPAYVVGRIGGKEGLALSFRRWLPTKALHLPGGAEREADLVAVADEGDARGPAWLLVLEAQSRHEEGKAEVLLLEAATFKAYAKDTDRPGVPLRVLPVFVYLQGEAPGRGEAGDWTPNGSGFGSRPALWELAKDSAFDNLDEVRAGRHSWGALFWVALMAGAGDDAVIDLWIALRDRMVPQKVRADLTHVALTFAELAGIRRDWDRIKGGIDMTESALFNELVELKALKDARKVVLRGIKIRFPELAAMADVTKAIEDQPSLEMLEKWQDAAFGAKDAGEFLAVLRR